MLIHDILEVEEEESILLAEESLADLITLPVTSEIVRFGLDAQDSIEVGEGLGVAFRLTEPAEFWLVLTDHYSDAKIPKVRCSKGVNCSKERFRDALVEYFAVSLSEELFCESCPVVESPLYVQERIDRLEDFLQPILPQGDVMEICCGSGMATQALCNLGFDPWAGDVDGCEVCQALKAGCLDPRKTMVLDTRILGRFFEPRSFKTVAGFMVGLIDDVNWAMWREVLLKASEMARDLIIYTTYTENEGRRIAEALGAAGWEGEVIDSRDGSGIYDQWAYVARRK